MVVSLDCGDKAAQVAPLLGRKPVYGEGSIGTTMKTKNSGEGNQWSQCVESRYRKVISLPFPSMTAASLHTVGHGCRVPLPVELGLKSGSGKSGRKPFAQGWTHTSNLGFQLYSVVTMGRKVMERHGERSENLKVFQH